jgi:hypothetical protein
MLGNECECRVGWDREKLSMDWRMRELKRVIGLFQA